MNREDSDKEHGVRMGLAFALTVSNDQPGYIPGLINFANIPGYYLVQVPLVASNVHWPSGHSSVSAFDRT
jgi:membrane-associated phospholipid phosphatase